MAWIPKLTAEEFIKKALEFEDWFVSRNQRFATTANRITQGSMAITKNLNSLCCIPKSDRI
jgi:hypothetical protein